MVKHMKQRSESCAHRVAEEMQLLAEQKWLIEVIKKIRSARNSLQIERFHLESIKAKMARTGDGMSSLKSESAVDQASFPDPAQLDMTLMSSRQMIEFETPPSDETVCNNEELDLGVSAVQPSEFLMACPEAPYEEYDEDDDNESLDDNDIEIDMNMFMNAYNPNVSGG